MSHTIIQDRAAGAIIAVIHDVIISVGVYSASSSPASTARINSADESGPPDTAQVTGPVPRPKVLMGIKPSLKKLLMQFLMGMLMIMILIWMD